ncbi:MAG: TIGR01777 family oxidoreductase [Melioribacteraceae bacterium]|nr:TIGR01777 family oxidoreductase [Melioribacteraceae bacterium]
MKVAITGATGLIGKKIVKKLVDRGDQVLVLTRSVEKTKGLFSANVDLVEWDIKSKDLQTKLEGVDAIIHLAGENVMGKRWNDEHKNKILESRIIGTRSIVDAIYKMENRPKVLVGASAVGYYGNSEIQVDELSNVGTGFLADVVKAWENETVKVEMLNVRRVNVRIGIVLDKNEGALAKLLTPFRLFVGGALGSGNQWFPWVHVEDVVDLFLFSLDNNINGVVNAVSPDIVRMNEFCKVLGKMMKRPSYFNVPEFVLKLVIGEAAEVILTGANVSPKRTIELGYKFIYPNLKSALKEILE